MLVIKKKYKANNLDNMYYVPNEMGEFDKAQMRNDLLRPNPNNAIRPDPSQIKSLEFVKTL